MSFLNLWALWVAAAVVPALLILYFLKLRRREHSVPSTLLWRRAVQDLQVNAPFQRLRKNLLLLLQLLILALAILALARPIVETSVAEEERVVVLIDRSASMNTREGGQTRLDLAKEQAVRLVKTFNQRTQGWRAILSLSGAEARTRVMVIAFSDRATIISPFTTNTGDLVDLIRGITPTDGQTDMAEALELAEAYMAPPTMTTDKTPISAEAPAKMVLISDGRIAGLDKLVLKGGSMEWIQIGEVDDNLGITALRTQRNYERPEILSVFLTVRNFGREERTTDVRLYVDGTLVTGQSVTLAGRPPEVAPGDQPDQPPAEEESNSVSLSFDLPLPQAAVLEARLRRDDALMVDNVAAAVVPPPRKLRVLVVSERNILLDGILAGLPLQEYPFIQPREWEANVGGRYEKDGQATFDVVIFDKYTPERLPAGNYLFLDAVPTVEGFEVGPPIKNHALIWWDETHPILRHVALEYVFVGESLTVRVPEEAEVLVEGPEGPVLVRYAWDGHQAVVLTFAIENSTWWYKNGFGIFMYNVIPYLGGGGAATEEGPLRPGDSLRIPAPAGASEITLVRPQDGSRVTLVPDRGGVAYYGGADRAGVYRVEDGVTGRDRFAVNLEDEWESDISPPVPETVKIENQPVQQLGLIKTATPEVWRWFIGGALVLVLLEWWIYNRRVMI